MNSWDNSSQRLGPPGAHVHHVHSFCAASGSRLIRIKFQAETQGHALAQITIPKKIRHRYIISCALQTTPRTSQAIDSLQVAPHWPHQVPTITPPLWGAPRTHASPGLALFRLKPPKNQIISISYHVRYPH